MIERCRRDDHGAPHGVEWRVPHALGEVPDVVRVGRACGTTLEMGCEHALLELRELVVELQRDLLPNSHAH